MEGSLLSLENLKQEIRQLRKELTQQRKRLQQVEAKAHFCFEQVGRWLQIEREEAKQEAKKK